MVLYRRWGGLGGGSGQRRGGLNASPPPLSPPSRSRQEFSRAGECPPDGGRWWAAVVSVSEC